MAKVKFDTRQQDKDKITFSPLDVKTVSLEGLSVHTCILGKYFSISICTILFPPCRIALKFNYDILSMCWQLQKSQDPLICN